MTNRHFSSTATTTARILQLSSLLYLALLGFLPATSAAAPKPQASQEVFIDTVVASVNGQPITLSELSARLEPPRKLTFQTAAADPEVQYALDRMVLEQLILAEAENRRISVVDAEIDAYMNEVASRNQLTREGFEQALIKEHHNIANYRAQAKVDILRSKLASQIAQSGVGVSDEEVKKYLEQNPVLSKSGSKVKLRQILITEDGKADGEAKLLAEKVYKEAQAGEDFSELARQFSDGPEASEGGSLGVIAEEDLDSTIFDAIFSLKAEDTSEIVKIPSGYAIYHLDQRFMEKDEDQNQAALEEEVRAQLKQQKLEMKLRTYFTSDLFKAHSVDKKI